LCLFLLILLFLLFIVLSLFRTVFFFGRGVALWLMYNWGWGGGLSISVDVGSFRFLPEVGWVSKFVGRKSAGFVFFPPPYLSTTYLHAFSPSMPDFHFRYHYYYYYYCYYYYLLLLLLLFSFSFFNFFFFLSFSFDWWLFSCGRDGESSWVGRKRERWSRKCVLGEGG